MERPIPHYFVLLRTPTACALHTWFCCFTQQLSYSVGSSLYFAANKREASYNNLMDEALKKREAKLKPLHGGSQRKVHIMRCSWAFEVVKVRSRMSGDVGPQAGGLVLW